MKKSIIYSILSREDVDDHDTCNVHSIEDPFEIIVVNAGDNVSNNNSQFSCLVTGGISSPKYIQYSSINDSNTVRNEICEARTPVPNCTL